MFYLSFFACVFLSSVFLQPLKWGSSLYLCCDPFNLLFFTFSTFRFHKRYTKEEKKIRKKNVGSKYLTASSRICYAHRNNKQISRAYFNSIFGLLLLYEWKHWKSNKITQNERGNFCFAEDRENWIHDKKSILSFYAVGPCVCEQSKFQVSFPS